MLRIPILLSILSLLSSCQFSNIKKIICFDEKGENVSELIFDSTTAEVYDYDPFSETLNRVTNVESIIVGNKLKVREDFSFFEEPKLTLDLTSMEGTYKYFLGNTKQIECKYIKPPSLKLAN